MTPLQARDVEAIAAQIVPSGATPGAREAGVLHFIDHVHAGVFATQAPAFLAGLAVFQADVANSRPGVQQFADLPDADQFTYLRSIERTPFFIQMRFLTVLGLLALPSYGGIAGKIGVLVLEQGPRFTAADFKHDELDHWFNNALLNSPERNPQTFRRAAQDKAERVRNFPSLWYARMVGGSSNHFTANYWRFHEVDFNERSLPAPSC